MHSLTRLGEVKAKRRQMQALDSEIDDIHMRRLKADSEVVKLRRQKTSLERQMGNTALVLPAQQSTANLSEELVVAQDTFEALQIELAHSRQEMQRPLARSSVVSLLVQMNCS